MTGVILHSPTERDKITSRLLEAAAFQQITVEASSLCEPRGVDFLWRGHGGWYGVQRKELNDLFASFDDGRLSKEIGQMRGSLVMPWLLIEGRIVADLEGNVTTSGFGRPRKVAMLRKQLLTIAREGVHVGYASGIRDTVTQILEGYAWSQAKTHTTGKGRPAPNNRWGKPSNRDYQRHLLMGLPGVGATMADAILDHFGGCPLQMMVDEAALCEVPGIGRKKARQILDGIGGWQG